MSGKLCMGNNDVPNDVALSKAYCEGRKAQYDSYPGAAQNPHPAGTAANLAWKRGLDSVSSPTDPVGPRDCCALPARAPAP